jgi:DTW domain-containing protein
VSLDRVGHEPRPTCAACRRPLGVCYCRHVQPVDTKTRVVLLQHPRERDVAIGTGRMASLCLPNSELHVGIHWGDSAALARALSDPARPPALLYPGTDAVDVLRHPPAGPVTLVVVDGTWWQARKVLRENPALAALPRYAFTPPSPSEYRIRREPEPSYVSTLEALVHVLGALEGDPARFRAMLAPFRAMVDSQLAWETRLRGAPSRHARKPRLPPPPRVPSSLRERADDVVCVYGEANAWPYGSTERASGCDDELVHWVAQRMGTGETFDFIVAPRHPLSPATSMHAGLAAERLVAGGSAADLVDAWRSFLRGADWLCSWGHYVTALFAGIEGAELPKERLDLRQAARVYAGGKVGTLDDFVARIDASPSAPAGAGRAHARLAQITAIARAFAFPGPRAKGLEGPTTIR